MTLKSEGCEISSEQGHKVVSFVSDMTTTPK